MTKEDRVKLREMLLYLADAVMVVSDMENTPSCNDCGLKHKCAYCPKPGQVVRYNCPLWRDKPE